MSRQRVIDGVVKKATPKALLVSHGDEETWVPRSVCLDGDTLDEGDTDLVIAEWFCDKEGIE